MRDHDDPVDAVILAFLDHREGIAPAPTLDHLTDDDRLRAQALLDSLVASRGIDPHASRPSIELMLADTPLARLLPAPGPSSPGPSSPGPSSPGPSSPGPSSPGPGGPGQTSAGSADLATVQRVLAGIDSRARVEVDSGGSAGATVVYSYLDLRARFLLVPTGVPVVTEPVRAVVERIFSDDPDTSRVGVVVASSDQLVTQLLSAPDIGQTITTPRGEPHLRWDPPLPLALVARKLVEQSAPEWPAFDFDQALTEALDVRTVAAEIVARVIEHESARSYRGDKRRAYRALVGTERAFADLVSRVYVPGNEVDLNLETTRICQAAAA